MVGHAAYLLLKDYKHSHSYREHTDVVGVHLKDKVNQTMAVALSDVESLVFEVIEELLETVDTDFEDELAGPVLLVADLGFSSIDFVQMIVSIEEKLGTKVGFQDMLMQDGKYVEDLSLGQVVDFTLQRLSNPVASAAPVQVSAPVAVESAGPTITEDDVARFTTLIKPRKAAGVTPSGGKNPRAVFVLSPPRSGSTLLRVMLAGNPELFAPPELHVLSYASMDERRADLDGERGDQLREGAVRSLMQTRGWSAEQARALIEDCEARGEGTGDFYARLQADLGGRLLVDKTPTYAFSVDILRQAENYFDDPLYIHLVRHPCGMIRSYEESDLTRMMPLMMKSSEFSSAAVAEMIWLLSNRNIMQFAEQVPSQRWCSVSYEQIVSDPQAQMTRLCDFMGVNYHQDMIHPYSDNNARMTDGVDSSSKMSGDLKFHLHSQIDPAAASRWRQFCSESMLGQPTLALLDQIDAGLAKVRM